MWTDIDRWAMARALALAERGRGRTDPNPVVGCVLVVDGTVVGEGYHPEVGGPHAEVVALEAAGRRARGATAYVTLEPCRHHGRTPPCTDALLAAGVRRVVYAVADPDPVAAGGAEVLRAAGVEVASGLLAPWAERQNEVFLHTRRRRRPFVTLKLAQTASGSLVGEQRWITGTVARREVHRLRSRVDAVLVGVGTVLADDPLLTVRDVEPTRPQPRAVVLDSRGRTPLTARVVRPGTVVCTTSAAPLEWWEALQRRGVTVLTVRPGAGGVDLDVVLGELLHLGVHHLLVEGGERVAASFVSARLVDRLVLHIATDDGWTPTAAVAEGRWRWRSWRRLGADLEVVAEGTTCSPV